MYPKSNMEMGPTFVHRNLRDDPLTDDVNLEEKHDKYHDGKGKGYASYNKPYSVMAWLETKVEEEYILMMDADMTLRSPVDPVALGAKRGQVVSAEYTYLYGTESGFANRFIPKSYTKRLAQVGGFHIFHRDDLRQIAPLWLNFTKQVRGFANTHPDEFFYESMKLDSNTPQATVAVRRLQARWHTEMYGYVFAAATVGVTHRIRRDVMLYPGYAPHMGRPPMIMHYGAEYKIGRTIFNKMSYQNVRLEQCKGFLFNDPGPLEISSLTKTDALSLEHLQTMNAAFCRFYARLNCSIPDRCGGESGANFEAQLDRVQEVLERCTNDLKECEQWALSAECKNNPLFMNSHCAKACGSCNKSLDEILPDDAHLGDWKYLEHLKNEPKVALKVGTSSSFTANNEAGLPLLNRRVAVEDEEEEGGARSDEKVEEEVDELRESEHHRIEL